MYFFMAKAGVDVRPISVVLPLSLAEIFVEIKPVALRSFRYFQN
jgi:hypothetical protein